MKERQSNIELLRIISMLMILCVHFTGATFDLPVRLTLDNISDVNTFTKLFMESISIIGVNCFVLISGYFGIKPTIKGIINFILWCVFYSVIIYSIYATIEPKTYTATDVINSFAIFSHTDLWFVPAYFALYIISPIINNGIKAFTRKKFIIMLFALTFLNVYLGWYWKGNINPTGYNLMQLAFIYIIGRFLRLHAPRKYTLRRYYVIGYIVSLVLIFTSTMYCDSKMAFAYNSPFVIMASISFFIIFTTFRIRNKYINFIASSAFAVYLIHKMPPVWIDLKNFLIDNTASLTPVVFAIYWTAFILAIFSMCILIDKLRMTITNPIVKRLTKPIKHIV